MILSDNVERSFRNLVRFYDKDLKNIYKGNNRATELFTDVFIKGLITKGVLALRTGPLRTHILTDKTIKVLRLK